MNRVAMMSATSKAPLLTQHRSVIGRNSMTAGSFASSDPGSNLLIAAIALQPQVALLNMQLEVSGQQWQEKQYAHAFKHNTTPTLRVTDAASGRICDRFPDLTQQ